MGTLGKRGLHIRGKFKSWFKLHPPLGLAISIEDMETGLGIMT